MGAMTVGSFSNLGERFRLAEKVEDIFDGSRVDEPRQILGAQGGETNHIGCIGIAAEGAEPTVLLLRTETPGTHIRATRPSAD